MPGRKSKYFLENSNINKIKIWNVGVYIRLSQEDSDNGIDKIESNSVTSQKKLINEFIEDNNDLKIFNTYVDDGFSGTDFERPAFQKLIEDMKNKYINCIVVKDLSRLGRNYSEAGNYIEKIFPLFNVRFISVNDYIDSFKNPESVNTILVPFKNLINDEYARDVSIKIKSSLNSRKRQGEFIGAFPSYGYIKDTRDKHKLVIDEESAKIVKKIFEWKANEGLGDLSICHRLNDMGILNPTGYKNKKLNQNYNNFKMKKDDYSWCPSTVRNILKNDIYIGNITQGKRRTKSYKIHKIEQVPKEEWITVENMHEPIIEKELFEKVQGLKEVDTRVQKDGKISIWAGKLKCADCTRAMHKKYSKNKTGKIYEYYICGTYRKKSNKMCTKHTIKINELENSVLQIIKLHIELFINTDNLLEEINKNKTNQQVNKKTEKIKEEKNAEIEKINKLKKGLYEDWKENYITKEEYKEYKQKYEEDIEKLKIIIKNLDIHVEQEKKVKKQNTKWIEDFKKNKNITELDRDVVTELIDYIEIYENKKIKIHFKFINEFDKIKKIS